MNAHAHMKREKAERKNREKERRKVSCINEKIGHLPKHTKQDRHNPDPVPKGPDESFPNKKYGRARPSR